MASAYEINAPAVAGEIIEGEAIILHLPRGHYYSAQESGAFIWAGIERRLPTEVIIEGLAHIYSLDQEAAAKDAEAFFQALTEQDLIRPCTAEAGSWSEVDPPASTVYEAPRIDIYTDMQDLLLLDPIHDVDTAGWPIAPDRPAP